MDIIKYYLYYLDSRFTGFPLVIRIVVIVVTLLALFYIASMIRFFFIMRRQRKEERLHKNITKRFEEKLKSLLFSRQSFPRDVIIDKLEFEPGSLKNKEKEPLTELLLSVKKREGQTLNEYNYSEVIEIFGLVGYWELLLRKNNLRKNKQALRMLEELSKNIPDGNIVAHRVQGRNHDLRKHSKSGYMRFATYDAFKFLEDDFDREFNSLDEMRIHATLEERAKQRPLPLLIRWGYTAKNESYKCFLIKEIGLFNQRESGAQLVEMYQTEKSYPVKAQIAETLGILQYTDAIDVLIADYGLTPISVQERIIEAVGKMDSPKALAFLEKIHEETQEGALQIKIVDSIHKCDKAKHTFNRLKQKSTDSFLDSVFVHVEKTNEKSKINTK
ncbi:MAG: HEAT repeat domain-containing protein [Bacteroidetes bacterium]|nr:HEAT repeat domain-containing protein [Bacteroidota bacterium]